MDFLVTPEFVERYEQFDDAHAICIDKAIRQIAADPEGPWARRQRVVGEDGWAWLVIVACGTGEFGLYWRQAADGIPVLLLLVDK